MICWRGSLQAYRNFFNEVGFNSHYNAMQIIWETVCNNLRCWSDNEMVITETLKLLKDITSGYESSKMLLDLESVSYVLQHHTVRVQDDSLSLG